MKQPNMDIRVAAKHVGQVADRSTGCVRLIDGHENSFGVSHWMFLVPGLPYLIDVHTAPLVPQAGHFSIGDVLVVTPPFVEAACLAQITWFGGTALWLINQNLASCSQPATKEHTFIIHPPFGCNSQSPMVGASQTDTRPDR